MLSHKLQKLQLIVYTMQIIATLSQQLISNYYAIPLWL
jgi:hypothetical protein